MPNSSSVAFLLVRLGFGVFILVWGLNKLINPTHTQAIFENFYYVSDLSSQLGMLLGILQVGVALLIISALYKTFAYGLGVAIHGTSTIATAPHLLLPFADGSNLLFMAGLPVLLSAIGLFVARDADTLLSLDAHFGRCRIGAYSRQSS